MKILFQTDGITKKDIINMKSGSLTMKDNIGKVINVAGACQIEDVDQETGEMKVYNYLMTDDGTFYSGNSVVVRKVLPDIIDLIVDQNGEPVTVRIDNLPTKGKGDAVTLRVM